MARVNTANSTHVAKMAVSACLALAASLGLARASPLPAAPGEHVADYDIGGGGHAFHAANAEQNYDLVFHERGFSIQPRNAQDGWSFHLELLDINKGAGGWLPTGMASATCSGSTLAVDHGTFRMCYANAANGMRHDLIVMHPPGGTGPLRARLRMGGNLVPLQVGEDRILFNGSGSGQADLKPVLDYSGLVAWDAAGTMLPARMRLEADVLVLEVDDSAAAYPVTIDPLSTSPDAVLNGSQAASTYGYSVATAGDVNGDGYSDLLVGIPNYDTPAVDAGMVQLFLGSATGIAATPAWTASGAAAGNQFGFSVSSAGDINGDGYSDVVVGAPGASGSAGAVYFYLGSAAGLGAVPVVRTGDAQAGSKFGFSVALAGDVNGDGYSDVIIGAPLFDNPLGGVDHGKAYVYHGAASIPAAYAWAIVWTSASGQYGFSVAGAGDLNGDGYSDVAIGAPFQNRVSPPVPAIKTGNVFLYKGSAAGLVAMSSLSGSGTNAEFGSCVSGAGDTNGDGYADLLVGAPGVSGSMGWVGLYHGSATGIASGSSANSSRGGPTAGDRLGAAVAMAGDLNGDGFADVVVGSPGYSTGKGRGMAFFGNAAGLNLGIATPPWAKNGATAGDALGTSVGTAGDVNGDGISDLFTSAPAQGGAGVVSLYHGGPSLPATAPSWSVLGGQTDGDLGRVVASAGDVNGDGYADVLVGAPGLDGKKGRAMLYLGSASGLSATAAWTAYGENPQDQFGVSVASAGDVNGDGYSDVVVGAPSWPSYGWRGKAYLYLGGPGGLGASPAWTRQGENVGDRFGWSVASAGDVNGDGYSDVAMGAYTFGTSVSNEHGKAYVFHGSATGLGAVPAWTDEGTPQSFFGNSVSLAGDVNGDGYDDLIVGAPFHDLPGGNNYGAAFVYFGSPTGLMPTPGWSAFGEVAGDEFGISASTAGDVNGDGYSDVVVGAYRHNVGANNQAGRTYVYHGQPTAAALGAVAATTIDGLLPDEHLGNSVCSAGDVNGDGFSDVLVGAPGGSFLYPEQGRMAVHLGSAAGVPAISSLDIWGPGFAGAHLGTCVALAGDVNGDGYSDLVAGAPLYAPSFTREGGAFQYFGGGAGISMRTFQYKSDLTTQVRTSNGTFEAACNWGIGQYARTSMGRGLVKLAWQFIGHGPGMPVGVLMPNNSTAFTGQGGSWTDSGLGGSLIKQGLTGPAGSSHPAWRARVRHHPATALDGRMYGRWIVQGIHDLQVRSIKTNLVVCGPLPVTMLGSSVSCVNGAAVLEWATASEQDCAGFRVMRSADGSAWEAVETLPCQGNSSHMVRYTATDPGAVKNGVGYYRLDQFDINGTMTSFPAMVYVPCAPGAAMAAWPNPVDDVLFLAIPGNGEEGFHAELLDMWGRVVAQRPLEREGGTVAGISGLGGLAPGTYVVRLLSGPGNLVGHWRMVKR